MKSLDRNLYAERGNFAPRGIDIKDIHKPLCERANFKAMIEFFQKNGFVLFLGWEPLTSVIERYLKENTAKAVFRNKFKLSKFLPHEANYAYTLVFYADKKKSLRASSQILQFSL